MITKNWKEAAAIINKSYASTSISSQFLDIMREELEIFAQQKFQSLSFLSNRPG